MKAIDILTLSEDISISDIPKHFRVAFDLVSFGREDTVTNLLKGYISGVKGISASKMILIHFFGVARDAMLVMDAKKTLELNRGNIEKIDYSNPEALMKDNMKLLHRIWSKSESMTDGVIYNLFEYVMAAVKKLSYSYDLLHAMEYTAMYQDFSYWYRKQPGDRVRINSVEDAAMWVMKIIPKMIKDYEESKSYRDPSHLKVAEKVPKSDWIKLITYALGMVNQVYGSEEEWVVNSNVLNVPPMSKIFVLVYDKPEQEQIDKYKSGSLKGSIIGDRIEHYLKKEEVIQHLKKMYTVIHVDAKRFDDIKTKYFEKHK